MYTPKFKIKVKAKKVITKDSVGAGDCFIAGIIFYLEKFNNLDLMSLNNISKTNWINCLNSANLVSAKNCSKEGCDPPFIKDMKKFIKFQK